MSVAANQVDIGRRLAAETVDRTIRNQRCGYWPAWALFGAVAVVWMPAIIILDRHTPREWDGIVGAATCLLILGSVFPLLMHLERRPVHRIKIGDELRAFPRPGARFQPPQLKSICFSNDEGGDYVEGARPVPLCQVVVEGRRGRPIRLVASVGDAARLREWAKLHGVPVVDPHGLASPRSVAAPAP